MIFLKAVVLSSFLMPSAVLGEEVILRKGEALTITNDSVPGSYLIEVTASPKTNKQTFGMGATHWGIVWDDTGGNTVSTDLSWGNSDLGAFGDTRFLRLTVCKNDSVLCTEDLTESVDLYRGKNTLRILVDDEGNLKWDIGSIGLGATGNIIVDHMAVPGTFKVYAKGSDLKIEKLRGTPMHISTVAKKTKLTSAADFKNQGNKSLSPCGVWQFLDRDNDPRWAKPGGRYMLGIAQSEENANEYDIIYLDGAVTNAQKWEPGMLKGKLEATPFSRHYNLTWIDALFDILDRNEECSASLSDDGAILTLSFPMEHTTLRFYRP